MDWNPETQAYCRNCNCYQAIGTYIYELERDPAKRKCKHLARCKRVADFIRSSSFGEQMTIDINNSDQNLKGVNEL